MYLYILNTDITFDQAKYLLDHLKLYNGEACDVVEVTNTNIQDIKSGYLSKLTRCKLKHQLTYNHIDYYITHDYSDVIYYLVQTQQIKSNDIFKICRYNATKCLKVLIEQGINVNIQNKYGDTPLHFAISTNKFEIVKLLILKGANVNIQNNRGCTPLHFACCNNSVESVKLLIVNGSNVNIQDNNGDTPLQVAVREHAKECIKLLQNL